jgi:hypothetical protein
VVSEGERKTMRPKIADEVLTQAFEAATVVAELDPIIEVTDDGEVDNDPTLVMPRSEIEILRQVCSK